MAKKHKENEPNPPIEPVEEIHEVEPDIVDLDNVFDDELVEADDLAEGEPVSGVFSSVARIDADSAVNPRSEVIRGEPLSDSVVIEPIADMGTTLADSDVHVEPITSDDLVEVVDDTTDVLHGDRAGGPSTGGVALPESAISEEIGTEADAIGVEDLGVVDSSVSLKSYKHLSRSPEKEPILDLDEPTTSLESPEPAHTEPIEVEQTVEFDGDRSDADFVGETSAHDEAVNFGDKNVRAGHGFDPLVESLESGVQIEKDATQKPPMQKPPIRARKPAPPPSVEFDDLVVDDVEVEEVAPPPAKGKPAKAKAAAAVPAEDDIDIDNLLANDSMADAEVEVDASADPTEVEAPAADIEPEPEPAVSRRGKKAAAAVTAPASSELPYQEPARRGGWGGVLGGVVVGLLLAGGAAATVWFAAPELIPTPNAPKLADVKPIQPGVVDPKVAPKDEKAEKAEAAQARWFEYAQKQDADKKPLSKDDDDVKTALKDLRDAGRDMQAKQIESLIDAQGALALLDAAKKGEEAAKDDAKKAVDDKEKAETLIAGVTKTLVDAKQLDEKDKLDPAVIQKLVKDVGDAKTALAAVDKLLDSAKVGMGEKGVEKLVAEKKNADNMLAAVAKALEDAQVKDPGAKGVAEIAASRDKIAKDREELDKAVKQTFQELVDGKLVAPDADPRKALAEGAKSARLRSESPLAGPLTSLAGSLGSLTVGLGDAAKGTFRQAELVAEIELLRVRDALVPSPGRQLDRLAMILENPDEKDPRVLQEATNLADWALADKSNASPDDKAKARWLRALVARGKSDFDTARKEAESVKDAVAGWSPRTKQAYRELLDPAAFYLPRIERLRSQENYVAAMQEIDAALKALPDNPRLKSERSGVALELLRGGQEDPKAAATIRADAEEALKNPKTFASAAVTIGKLAESTGNAADAAKAEELYRQALKSGTADESQSAELRLGLGRLLLRKVGGGNIRVAPKEPAVEEPKAEPKAPPKTEPKEPKVDPKADPKEEPKEKDASISPAVGPRLSSTHPLFTLLAAALVAQPALPEAEETSPELKEAIDLARQLLAESKDKRTQAQARMLLGEALSRSGRRTEGLREYAKGLQMLQPGADFVKLLDEHPAFQTADSDLRSNPILAEKHFGQGLHDYREGKIAAAESQFRQAITYFDKDARYHYWLGLCQIDRPSGANRQNAAYSWEQAARLEANSRPSTDQVNQSLERIQGPRRILLDSYRSRPTNP